MHSHRGFHLKTIRAILFFLFLIPLIQFGGGGCGSNPSQPPSPPPPTTTGTVSVQLTDSTAPGPIDLGDQDPATPDIQTVFVTVDRVEMHQNGDAPPGAPGTVVVSDTNQVVNLSELANGVFKELGLNDSVPAGTYNQMRLILSQTPEAGQPFANFFIDTNGITHELKVPSGFQTGVKLTGSFTVEEGGTTDLLLDWDVQRSIVKAGASGQWLLKPVIRIIGEVPTKATVTGQVLNSTNSAPIPGATVSAQVLNPSAPDPADRVTVVSSTSTDTAGNFSLILPPGDYTLVASAQGFISEAAQLTLAAGQTVNVIFTLDPSASNGTIRITLSIPDIDINIFASLSFRAMVNLQAGGQALVEVAFVNLGDDGTFIVQLPASDVNVVASVFTLLTFESNVQVTGGQVLDVNIQF